MAETAFFDRLVDFLADSSIRYGWFPKRMVVMPDHLHLIAHDSINAGTLGKWVKAMKAVSAGVREGDIGEGESLRIPRSWLWQDGFHDHRFRSSESESRKWECICMNPVRAGLVERPEQWPFGGEFVYEANGKARFVPGMPPLLERVVLIPDDRAPGEGTRPTVKRAS